ncbi:hypothetical protein [Agromyces bauzanensis]
MKRIIAGLGSLVVVLALVVGIPAALIAIAGNPLPMTPEALDAFTRPDYGGQLLLGTILPIAAWIAWAGFTLPFLWSIPAAIRDARDGLQAREREQHGAFGFQRRTAGVLIGAIVMMGASTTAAVAAPAEPAHAAPQSISQPAITETATPAPTSAPTAAAVETAATELEQRTIVPGDTLWDIAEQELGDGTRYPEIFDASAATVQPDGQQLTDPDLILPGWDVSIPGTSVAPAPVPAPTPAPVPAPAPSGSGTIDTAPGAAAEHDTASEAAADIAAPAEQEAQASAEPTDTGLGFSNAAPEEANEADVDVTAEVIVDDTEGADDWAVPAMTAGGIAGILAAGLLSALGIRRALQRRRRRSGERIAMPARELADFEHELRTVETTHLMDEVDQALRYLAAWGATNDQTLPELYAVRLAPDAVSLFLDAPAELPPPFLMASEDGQAWTLPAGALEGVTVEEFASPYPALVTIGRDAREGLILIDLEHWGAVNVIGDPELTKAALTALALELGNTRWGDELQVTLVGVAPELATALRARHVRHLDSTDELLTYLRAQISDTRAALAGTPHSTPAEARRAGSDEAWLPEIVILGQEVSPAVRAQLAEIVSHRPRLGIAAVAAGRIADGATINLHSSQHATFSPAGVEFVPQLVDEDDLHRIVQLLDTTDEPATRAEHAFDEAAVFDAIIAGQEVAPATVATPVDVESEPVDLEPAPEQDREPEQEPVDEISPTAEPELVAEPVVDSLMAERVAVDVDEPALNGPYVRLLGPVSIDVPGFDPTVGKTPPGRGLELVAFLALHPNATSDEFAGAFWPVKTRQQATESMKKLTSTTRSWLGIAADGELYFPRYTAAEGYRVHAGVRTDWGHFQELIGDDLTTTTTERLIAALKLVHGQPFTGVSDRFWAWSALDKEDMIAAIADAADELFRRASAAQDHIRAKYAATLGNTVAPESEVAWRNLLMAALKQGDVEEFERITERLYSFLDSFEEGYEPEPETRALIDQGRRQLEHA